MAETVGITQVDIHGTDEVEVVRAELGNGQVIASLRIVQDGAQFLLYLSEDERIALSEALA